MNTDTTINTLDLDCVIAKLMHAASGEGWSRERADAIALEYRRFLWLMKNFPHERTAPMCDVDTFWHYHILDTMKYAADCDQVFGYFLHHFPYIGMRGEDDLTAQEAAGERMQELYEQAFGKRQYARAVDGADRAAYCGVAANSAGGAAYCGVAATIGRARVVSGTACYGPTGAGGAPAYCGIAQSGGLDGFYAQRPQLAAAAV
jgi:hypothetical protein